MRSLNIPLDILESMYVDEQYTVPELALEFNCSECAIFTRLAKLGVLRTRSEAAKLRIEQGRNNVFGKKGEENPAWRGGRHMRGEYWNVWAPEHPRNNGGYVYEHILVYEKAYLPPGQYLPINILVHHDNGIKTDNRPENLIAVPRGKHEKILPEMAKRIRDLELQNKHLLEQIANLIPV